MQQADLIWQLYDASLGWQVSDAALRASLESEVWVLAAKSDLPTSHQGPGIPISVVGQPGLDGLLARFKEFVPPAGSAALLPRHTGLLEGALQAVEEARASLEAPVPNDLAAVPLQSAIRILGEITGETTPPDVIERIFHDFCIGK